MGWGNPPISWRDLEATLSDKPKARPDQRPDQPAERSDDGRERTDQGDVSLEGDGGDSPAWSRTRGPYVPPTPATRPPSRTSSTVPYAELHCH